VNKATFLELSSFQALAMFRRGMFYNFLSVYLRFYLGMSVTETTFFATFPMVLNVLFQSVLWGPLSDRFQKRRTLIIIGEIAASISTLAVWYVHTVPSNRYTAGYVIIIGLSLVEAFWSMSNVGWTALLSDLYPAEKRIGLQGRLASIGAVGRLFGVWTGGYLYDGFSHFYEGWGFSEGPLFFIASTIMFISAFPMFFVPEGGIRKSRTDIHDPKKLDSPTDLAYAKEVSRILLVFLIALVFINFGRNSIALIKAQYLSLDSGFDVSSRSLSFILNVESIGILLAGIMIGGVATRLGDGRLLISGTFIALVYLIGFAWADTLILVYLLNFTSGISFAVIQAASYSFASRLIPPEMRGKQFARFNATFFLSWGIPGTVIAGPIIDILIRSGSSQVFAYRMSFMAAGAMVLIGMIILFLAMRMACSVLGLELKCDRDEV